MSLPSNTDRHFRLLVEGVSNYAIYMLDPEGRVTSWNRGAEQIKQYTAEEILGRHYREFYPQEARARGEPEHNLQIARERGRFEETAWRLRKDGSRFWAHVLIDPLRDENGSLIGFAKVTSDMTERKRTEEALVHAQKMESIGQLSAGIA
ncbi:PAS domain S-box protein, partial [Rhodopseudomonas sp. B29]|uniref:PAS domain-containing protein n=1 Tax=Rhodopseudomonas sp. B29 TaxID=95607 RepID=UPI0004CE9400